MRGLEQIVGLVKQREKDIVDNIDYEAIAVYDFLQEEFRKGDVTLNYLFQFVYRSFYRLDNAGLTEEFKREYFKIMQKVRLLKTHNPRDIVCELYNFKRRKGDNSIQFSFTTKLINTIDENYPIYDSEDAKVFRFSTYNISTIEEKVERYLEQFKVISDSYSSILDKSLLKSTFSLFDKKFSENRLSDIKKLDFIIWSCGKLI